MFGGNVPGDAYSTAGAYQGDAGVVRRDVAAQMSVQVNVTGPDTFGVAGGPVGNVFEVLDRMAQAVAIGDGSALATEHANLDVAATRLGAATVEVGSLGARMNEIQVRAETDQLQLRTMLSEAEDVDLVEALVNAKAQENAYQAALQVAAKIIPMSLLDYLALTDLGLAGQCRPETVSVVASPSSIGSCSSWWRAAARASMRSIEPSRIHSTTATARARPRAKSRPTPVWTDWRSTAPLVEATASTTRARRHGPSGPLAGRAAASFLRLTMSPR